MSRRILVALLFVVPALGLAPIARAQNSPPVPASAALFWTLPTTALDGSALTGPQALTSVRIFASTSPISDAALNFVEEIEPGTSYSYSANVPNNSTLHFRVSACNVGGCSPLSAQATKQVSVAAPGAPSDVRVTVTVTLAVSAGQ